ncbi:MAG: hypothetical protein ACOCNL_11230 [Acetivibrio ethanolgignens]
MTIDEICSACINALRAEGYNESTIFNYEGVIRRFKQYCKEYDIAVYSSEIGKAYADDVISKKTGKFYRLIDSYFSTGTFDFSLMKKGRIIPDNEEHQRIYTEYNGKGIADIKQLSSSLIMEYIKSTKTSRQREMLCELRGIFRYLERADLYNAIAGIHAPQIKKIIPVLTDSELQKIYDCINEGKLSLRDAAIVMIVQL